MTDYCSSGFLFWRRPYLRAIHSANHIFHGAARLVWQSEVPQVSKSQTGATAFFPTPFVLWSEPPNKDLPGPMVRRSGCSATAHWAALYLLTSFPAAHPPGLSYLSSFWVQLAFLCLNRKQTGLSLAGPWGAPSISAHKKMTEWLMNSDWSSPSPLFIETPQTIV